MLHSYLLEWVHGLGNQPYLAADPMTVQEGWRAIAQAVTDWQVKARGPGHPCVNLPTQQPFRFGHPRDSPLKDTWGMLVLTVSHCHTSPQEAKTATDIGGSKGNHCFSYHHLPWTAGLRVIGAHYQWLHWCCPCQIDQRDPGIPNMGGNTEKMGPIWR